jgi:CDP-2,3-bis-(O-geranylgeranyl)-sn-glycerol synthase
MVDITYLILSSFAIIMPAYIANSMPVLSRGKRPIDLGRNFTDGRRILGDGKTFEGTALGLFFGTLVGTGYTLLTGSPSAYILFSFMLSLGALVGDMAGAFIKRRMNIPRGAPAPVLDQLDFVVGALIFLSPFYPITWEQVIFVILVTPPIHLFTNYLAYRLKLKPNPW